MLALDAVSFAWPGWPDRYVFELVVEAGEIVAVTGPSGSGKSTLLDLVAGFLRPLSGSVRLDGESLDDLPPERRPVSILFQGDNLFDHLTAARNVALGLPRDLPRQARARTIASALDEVGLSGLGDRPSARLSGGQKQRVALARTLARNKPVLLLDEPFSALDRDTAGQMRDLVARLTRANRWHTILVTHQQDDVDALADRRFALHHGTLHAG
ncbi:MAG TPA: ATP-binding cassette domain-containing protein [Devosiaceae bacterium]